MSSNGYVGLTTSGYVYLGVGANIEIYVSALAATTVSYARLTLTYIR